MKKELTLKEKKNWAYGIIIGFLFLVLLSLFGCKSQKGKYVITQASMTDGFAAHYYVDSFKLLPNGCVEFTSSSYKDGEHKIICGTYSIREK